MYVYICGAHCEAASCCFLFSTTYTLLPTTTTTTTSPAEPTPPPSPLFSSFAAETSNAPAIYTTWLYEWILCSWEVDGTYDLAARCSVVKRDLIPDMRLTCSEVGLPVGGKKKVKGQMRWWWFPSHVAVSQTGRAGCFAPHASVTATSRQLPGKQVS